METKEMKNFIVDVDFTFSKQLLVEAQTSEQAKEIANKLIHDNLYDYVKEPYVRHEIIDIYED